MRRHLSNPDDMPYLLAAYFVRDPDPIWKHYLTTSELDEILATVRSVLLRVEKLQKDEQRFMEILETCNTPPYMAGKCDGRGLVQPGYPEQ